jgi:hypothetical protein
MILVALCLLLTQEKPATSMVIADLLNKFDTHAIVGLAEIHRNEEVHAFFRSLIRDSRFTHHVRDIVVESGSAKFQPVLDRYLDGKRVSFTDLQHVWRDTTMIIPWDVPVYQQFFETVRDVNRSLPEGQRIHVYLGDPPIDWAHVHTAKDFLKYANRDTFYFKVVDRILAEHKKLLLIYGGMHLLKRDVRGPGHHSKENLPDLATRYGSRFYSIWTLVGKNKLYQPSVYPDMVNIAGTSLGKQSSKLLLPENITFFKPVNGKMQPYEPDSATMPRLEDTVDALLAVSPTANYQTPRLDRVKDRVYIKELRRRAKISTAAFGFDTGSEVESVITDK